MGWLDIISGVGSAAAGYGIAEDMRGVGQDAANQMGELAGQLTNDTAFKGYGVTTGLGTSTVNADGSMNVGVGPDAGQAAYANSMQGNAMNNLGMSNQMAQMGGFNPAYMQAMGVMQGGMQGLGAQQNNTFAASQQAMQNAMQGTAGREQDIYNRMMGMQQPGLDRAKTAQQANEYAMGRSGIRGSAFGGTGEDAAMAKAQFDAQNSASVAAMGQAQTEMMNQAGMAGQFGQMGGQMAGLQNQFGTSMGVLGQGQAQLGQGAAGLMSQNAQISGGLGNQAYGNQFLPMQQQLNALQVGGTHGASMAQTGQLSGAGYGAQLGLGGIQTQANMEKAASELYGNVFGSGMNALAGASGNLKANTGVGWLDKLVSYL